MIAFVMDANSLKPARKSPRLKLALRILIGLLLTLLAGILLAYWFFQPQLEQWLGTQSSQELTTETQTFLRYTPGEPFSPSRTLDLFKLKLAVLKHPDTQEQLFMAINGLEPPVLDRVYQNGWTVQRLQPITQTLIQLPQPETIFPKLPHHVSLDTQALAEADCKLQSIKIVKEGLYSPGLGQTPVPYKQLKLHVVILPKNDPLHPIPLNMTATVARVSQSLLQEGLSTTPTNGPNRKPKELLFISYGLEKTYQPKLMQTFLQKVQPR